MTPHLGLQRIMIPGSQVSALTTGNITLAGARGVALEYPYPLFAHLNSSPYSVSTYQSGTKTVMGGIKTNNATTYVTYLDNGAISWQKTIDGAFDAYNGKATISPNGNVIMAGQSGGSQAYAVLAIFSSSGTNTLLNTYRYASTQTAFCKPITDSSNNIYAAGTYNGYQNATMSKFNSSGTLQWSTAISIINYSGALQDVDVDSSGNVYGAGYMRGGYQGLVTKYNSSGTLQWNQTIKGSSSPESAEANHGGVAVDSSGNVYAGGGYSTSGGSNRRPVLFKHDSSGALQWQRELAYGTAAATYYSDVTVGADGYIYAIEGNYLVKYNSSGSLQWQRKFTNATVLLETIQVDGANIILGGKIGGTEAIFFIVPTDGSKTGTYTLGSYTVVYEAGTATEQASSAIVEAGGQNGSSASYTLNTSPGYAISNSTHTLTKVNL